MVTPLRCSIIERTRVKRNLVLALAASLDEDSSQAYAMMNYGRAWSSAGRSVEAVEMLQEATAIADDPITKRMASRIWCSSWVRLGRFDEVVVESVALREVSASQIGVDIAEGRLRVAMGDAEDGLSLLARVSRGVAMMTVKYAAHMLAAIRGEALASSVDSQKPPMSCCTPCAAKASSKRTWVSLRTGWSGRSDRRRRSSAALEVADLMPVLGRVLRQKPLVADTVLEGIWGRGSADRRLARRRQSARASINRGSSARVVFAASWHGPGQRLPLK